MNYQRPSDDRASQSQADKPIILPKGSNQPRETVNELPYFIITKTTSIDRASKTQRLARGGLKLTMVHHATSAVIIAAAAAVVAAESASSDVRQNQNQNRRLQDAAADPNPNRYIVIVNPDMIEAGKEVDFEDILEEAREIFKAKKIKRLKVKRNKNRRKYRPAVLEFNSGQKAADFKKRYNNKIIVEVDAPMYLVGDVNHHGRGLRGLASVNDADNYDNNLQDDHAILTAPLSNNIDYSVAADVTWTLPEMCDLGIDQFPCVPWGIRNVYDATNTANPNRGYPGDPERPGPDLPQSLTHPLCIIDSGYLEDHPDLPPAFNAADPSIAANLPYDQDGCGHGTHVSGSAIASINSGANEVGVMGVFPDASPTYIARAFGDSCKFAYTSTMMDAYVDCVEAGAKIINMALGRFLYVTAEANQLLDGYKNDDVLVIGAAGNHGDDKYLYPASYDETISVAAIDRTNARASFSAYNDMVDVAAPGVDIVSTSNTSSYELREGTSSKLVYCVCSTCCPRISKQQHHRPKHNKSRFPTPSSILFSPLPRSISEYSPKSGHSSRIRCSTRPLESISLVQEF